MLSKSKIGKLKKELNGYRITFEQLAEATGVSRSTIISILSGKTYNGEVIKKLIEIRNAELLKATELESLI